MLRTPAVLGVVLLALVSASCTKDSGATASKSAELPRDAESRLGRMEKRLDKIEEILGKALGAPQADPAAVYSVPIDPLDPVEGPADAKVTIVEGYEFACPYCLEAHPIMEQLLAEFPNDVRVVTKYLVVHQPAIPSGLAVCAANKQGKYTEMKRLLWQKAWGPDGRPIMEQLSPEAMDANAAALGLDTAKFTADMNSQDCRGWLEKSSETLNAVGQSGTPGFFVNGRALGGLVPFEGMKQIVTEELAKADKTIAGGVKQADFYKVAVVDKGLKKVKGWFDLDEEPAAD